MSFLQPMMLWALPLIAIPILIHLINQWRYQTKQWGAMMFLLAANRMNRGYARLRQWLILAMRAFAIAALVFLISRPLASSFLGLAAGGRVDTTLVLLDRSPSMQQEGGGGQAKLDTGKRQLLQTLGTLGSTQWVLIDSNTATAQTFGSLDALIDSPAISGSSATADIPEMLQGAVDYLTANRSGPTDLWICSDLRSADWKPDGAHWVAVRQTLQKFPQPLKIHLLAYPDDAQSNLSVRVNNVRRESTDSGEAVVLDIQVTHTSGQSDTFTQRSVPLQIDIDGARSELQVEMTGRNVEIRNHRVPVETRKRGSGKATLPADQNNADNEYYFVYDDTPTRRIVLVTDDREVARPLELAAGIAPNGQVNAQVDVVAPEQLGSSLLNDAALVMWQTALPQGDLTGAIEQYVSRGGQVIFFPPGSPTTGIGDAASKFLGVAWSNWSHGDSQSSQAVENWRSDQDLLAVTRSGVGLPVGQLEIKSYAQLHGELSPLATLPGGQPLLARVPTAKGGVYFCAVSPDSKSSTLATDGVVLYAVIQRAIEQGQASLGNATLRVAGTFEEPTDQWRCILSGRAADGSLSSQYAWQAGVYENDDRRFAVNRSLEEDQGETLGDAQVNRLFEGLSFSRVDDRAGNLSGIVREIWKFFAVALIAAMLMEAALCMPRKKTAASSALAQVRSSSPAQDFSRVPTP